MCGHTVNIEERADFSPASDTCRHWRCTPPLPCDNNPGCNPEFGLRAGERVTFVLVEFRPKEATGNGVRREALPGDSTFSGRDDREIKVQGRWREWSTRSALMFEALSAGDASLIARPTFSCQNKLGRRNWIIASRCFGDATFTLYALIRLGFVEETEASSTAGGTAQ